MAFLRNAWYMAGWADEVPDGGVFHRTLLDEPVVFFRDEAGALHALRDRCPHRFVPLHLGRVVGNDIMCAYHGLRFDGSGVCTHNPHSANTPKSARVTSYPVREQDGVAWIWMGEAAQAEQSPLPDFSFMHGVPETAASRGYLHTECNYKLVADNVMDLSHADFLHADSVGGGAFTRARPQVQEKANEVLITWACEHERAMPAYDPYMSQPGQPVDFLTQVRWRAPGIMKLDIAITPRGRPVQEGLQTHNAHIVTPESEDRTHYFFWLTRQFQTHDEAVNQRRQAMMLHAFSNEDKPMLREQQLAMDTDDLFALSPVLLPGDAGAVRARRCLEQQIRQEQAGVLDKSHAEAC